MQLVELPSQIYTKADPGISIESNILAALNSTILDEARVDNDKQIIKF